MRAIQWQAKGWNMDTTTPPKLDSNQWAMANLLGVVLIVMAVLQVASFSDFKDTLGLMGLSGVSTWAVCIIAAEVLAAIGFFKIPLSNLLRILSAGLALAVAGFWFVETLQVVSSGYADAMSNSGFFGRFLGQSPGWWTTVEATILLFWTIYIVGLFKDSMPKGK